MKHRFVGLVMAVMVVAGAADAQGPAPLDRQAAYDAAQAAFDASDFAKAAAGFAPLLPADPDKALSASQAVIAARYAAALQHTGRLDEAQTWIERAIPSLPASDPTGLALAWMTAGDVLRLKYDYQRSLDAYRHADALATAQGETTLEFEARIGEAAAGSTVDPAGVRAQLDALRTSPEFRDKAKPNVKAQVDILAARTALMAGDKATARQLARTAVDESGGLTDRVSAFQVAVRADAATIAAISRDDDDAKRYLAYTGAGHLLNAGWIRAHSGELPVCDDRVRPDDVVVVSITIGDDGRVSGAMPTYASRPGLIGQTFAEAVSHWSWNSQAIQSVEMIWRSTLQLGLRCVTRPDPASVGDFAARETAQWLRERGLLPSAGTGDRGGGLPLAVRTDDPRLRQPGGAVLAAAATQPAETPEGFDRLWAKLEADQGPPSAFALAIVRFAHTRSVWSNDPKAQARPRAEALARLVPRFETKFPGDRSLNWLLFELALARQEAGQFDAAQPSLERVIHAGDGKSDPLISVALLHQAIGFERTGHRAEAAVALQRSGLTLEQCSLFDTHPIADERDVNDAYPQPALNWGFEGYTETAFDIADNGTVENPRTVVAYPPFVFDGATEKAVLKFHYVPPRIGGHAAGCAGAHVNLNYRLD